MGATFVKYATGPFSGGGSPSLAFSGTVAANDVILVLLSKLDSSSGSITGVQDDRGNSYSLLGTFVLNVHGGSNAQQHLYLFAAVNGSTQTVTVQPQITGSPSFWLTIEEFSGVSSVPTVDQSLSVYGYSDPEEAGPVTTLVNDELLLSYVSNYIGAGDNIQLSSTASNPTFTRRFNVYTDALGGDYSVADATVTSTGTYYCNWNPAGDNSAATIITLSFAAATYSISGNAGVAGATVSCTGQVDTTADGSGNYSFAGLADGLYTITPSKTGYTFASVTTPYGPTQDETVSGTSITGVDFVATLVVTNVISSVSTFWM